MLNVILMRAPPKDLSEHCVRSALRLTHQFCEPQSLSALSSPKKKKDQDLNQSAVGPFSTPIPLPNGSRLHAYLKFANDCKRLPLRMNVGVVPVGSADSCFLVVDDQPLRNAAERVKRILDRRDEVVGESDYGVRSRFWPCRSSAGAHF